MDVLLDDEEIEVQSAVGSILEKEATPELARAHENAESGVATDLWERFGDLGWPGLCLPEEVGGGGMPLGYAGLVAEQIGRSLAPLPFVTTAAAGWVIGLLGTPAQREAWLPGVVEDHAALTLAVEGRGNVLAPAPDELVARRQPDGGFVLDGRRRYVENLPVSSVCLTAAHVVGADGSDEGTALFLVPTDADGLSTVRLVATAKDDLRHLDFAQVRLGPDALLGEGATPGARAFYTLLDTVVALSASRMAGAARRVTEVAADYAKIRHAFGQPIGAFQAIQHLCADMLIWVDGSDLLNREALWFIDRDQDPRTEASQAKAFANVRLVAACRGAQQIHGGLGFTAECDVNLYYRRVVSWAGRLGNASQHHRRIASDLLDGPESVRLDRLPPSLLGAAR